MGNKYSLYKEKSFLITNSLQKNSISKQRLIN